MRHQATDPAERGAASCQPGDVPDTVGAAGDDDFASTKPPNSRLLAATATPGRLTRAGRTALG